MLNEEDIQFFMQHGASHEDAVKFITASKAPSVPYASDFNLEDCVSVADVKRVLQGYSDSSLMVSASAVRRSESRRPLIWRGEVTFGDLWDALDAEKVRRLL